MPRTSRKALLTAFGFAFFVASSAASADEVSAPPLPKSAEIEVHWQWYGYQTMIPDAAAIGLFYAATRTDSPKALLIAAGATYLLGAPLVHFAHGEWSKGAQSLGLRVGVPLLFAAIPLTVAWISGNGSLCWDNCTIGQAVLEFEVIVAAFAGAGVVMIGDSVGLATHRVLVPKSLTPEPIPQAPPPKPPPHPRFITALAPSVDIQKDRASIGLRGAF